MGFFDNLMFWKKKDDGLDLKGLDMPGVGKMGSGDPFTQKDFGSGSFGNNFGAGQGFGQQSFGNPNTNFGNSSASFDSNSDFGNNFSQQSSSPPIMQPISAQGTGVISQNSFGALGSGQQAQNFSQLQQKQFYEAPQSSHSQQFQMPGTRNPEIQILDAKIDSIKATLDSINQRLANIERVAYESREQPPRRPMW